jgi:hypothetical protein
MIALAYLDVGLVLFALTLVRPSAQAVRRIRELDQSFAVVYVAAMVGASLWPLVLVGLLLGWRRDEQ